MSATVVRVVLVNCGERHRHTDKRAALHRSRPPARGRLDGEVAGHARHARLVTDILARMSRGCYAENGPVECTLIRIFLQRSARQRRRRLVPVDAVVVVDCCNRWLHRAAGRRETSGDLYTTTDEPCCLAPYRHERAARRPPVSVRPLLMSDCCWRHDVDLSSVLPPPPPPPSAAAAAAERRAASVQQNCVVGRTIGLSGLAPGPGQARGTCSRVT